MNCTFFLIIFLNLVLLPIPSHAQVTDSQKFIKYNPDGKKYEFVKNYLISLTYLKKNAQRSQNPPEFISEEFEKGDFFKALMEDLVRDNINLRIARNFVKKYQIPENKLILKATNLFMQVCDEQISINNKERKYIGKVSQKQSNEGLEDVDRKRFADKLLSLSLERKESLRSLLEASMVINKLLISNQIDDYDEFVMLGVTEEEREKLVLQLDEFNEDSFQGEIRQGQTFLQGSVSVLREVLSDESWDTLEQR